MVKIRLENNVVFEICTKRGKNTVTIKNGKYDDKYYHSAVVNDNSVILEGEDNLLLESDCAAVYISTESISKRIAGILGNDDIFLLKAEALPEGKERDILIDLLNY